jgi:hypothetical protein
MPKKAPKQVKAAKRAKPARLPPLSAIEQQIMAFVTNNVVFDNYDDCCSVEDMAKQFQRTPGRFTLTLNKLVDKGYLKIKGEVLPWVYPTVVALQHQNSNLSKADAKKILKKIGG